jgi:quercetin dioxygenase-like cupin family protein
MAKLLVAFFAAALLVACVAASDADPINDYCVADLKSTLLINGLACKSPAATVASDFQFEGFRASAATNNPLGIGIIPGFASVNYPALNTQGLALAKFNYAKNGLVPPHTHPRASEVITVLHGEVYVGFVDTAGTLFAVTLKKNDFFLFPRGLVHFQLNVGGGQAVTVSVLNAQNPGVQLQPSALFGSSPPISLFILAKAFGISEKEAGTIQKGFQPAA